MAAMIKTPDLPNAERVVLLHSGGMESTAALFFAERKYGANGVLAVGFEFGGWHPGRLELITAEEQCTRLGVSFIKLSMRDEYHNNRGMVLEGLGKYDTEMRPLYPAPFSRKRNVVMVGAALGVAFDYNASIVMIGLESPHDREGIASQYRDDKFFDGLNLAADNNPELSGRIAKVMSPFYKERITKPEIVALMADSGGAAFLCESFSCFRPVGLRHCGECESCRDRIKAFAAAGVCDTTDYAA